MKVPALMVATTESETIEESHQVATQLLQQAQIHEQAIQKRFYQTQQKYRNCERGLAHQCYYW